MDAAGELAQLGERLRELRARLLEQLDRPRGPTRTRAGERERERQRDEPLLRAVVEVALEPPPLDVGGLDEPEPGGAQLLEAGAQLGLQALVLEREAGGGDHRVDELGMVAERGVVHDRGDRPAGPLDGGGDAGGAVGGQGDRVPVGIHVRAVPHPVRELERGVAEGAGECTAKAARTRAAPRAPS